MTSFANRMRARRGERVEETIRPFEDSDFASSPTPERWAECYKLLEHEIAEHPFLRRLFLKFSKFLPIQKVVSHKNQLGWNFYFSDAAYLNVMSHYMDQEFTLVLRDTRDHRNDKVVNSWKWNKEQCMTVPLRGVIAMATGAIGSV